MSKTHVSGKGLLQRSSCLSPCEIAGVICLGFHIQEEQAAQKSHLPRTRSDLALGEAGIGLVFMVEGIGFRGFKGVRRLRIWDASCGTYEVKPRAVSPESLKLEGFERAVDGGNANVSRLFPWGVHS